ncbi:MAG: DNA translocase FtsK 4TM domain-containing protein, partial [Deltaproteobacteria bacterium]|nr:DNA translocase FtsK 4TM domain-containing protein [Deltaproteobacteria bacterium]
MAKRARKKTGESGARRPADAVRVPGRLEAEAVAVGLFALAAFLEVSLFSYSPSDPWWGFGAPVENLCGPAGAALAGVLAGGLGQAAHMLPLAAVWIALRYLRGLPIRARWIPLTAWTGFAFALAGSLDAFERSFPGSLPAAAGGALGSRLVDGLASAFYLPGTHLLLGVGLVLTLLAATGLSIRDAVTLLRRGTRRVLRTVGQVAVVSFVRTRRRIERGLEARREARREVDAVAGEPSAAAVPRAA